MVKHIKFYTRPGCPLCDEAKLMLQLVSEDVALEIEEISIEDDDAAHEKYVLMIPVITCNSEIIQYGNVDYVTLREALDDSV